MPISPVEPDDDVEQALDWLIASSANARALRERIHRAQENYILRSVADHPMGFCAAHLDLGPDTSAICLAQADAMIRRREAYDGYLGSSYVPFIKLIGMGASRLDATEGARGRARNFVDNLRANAAGALFEFATVLRYSEEGFAVRFLEEQRGEAKRADIALDFGGTDAHVECKRVGLSNYEVGENKRAMELVQELSPLVIARALSVKIHIQFGVPMGDVPKGYLSDRIQSALDSSPELPDGYSWRDDFASGTIGQADIESVRRDTEGAYLLFGPKMARLLASRPVPERSYYLIADAVWNKQDTRYVDSVTCASVVTWDCLAEASLSSRARHVRSKLAEIDQQLESAPLGFAHIGIDADRDATAASLRQSRNAENVRTFAANSGLGAVYVHYFVPRFSETAAWMIDETTDQFFTVAGPPLREARILFHDDRQSAGMGTTSAWHLPPPGAPE